MTDQSLYGSIVPSLRPIAAAAIVAGALFAAAPASADTSASAPQPMDAKLDGPAIGTDGFDAAMSGTWKGGGDVLVKIEQDQPFRVKCDMQVDATEALFSLEGSCGALFMKRPIAVALKRTDEGVAGTYDAKLRTGQAELAGEFDPGAMDLDITWGGDVNGDTEARMTIERTAPEELRVRVVDRNVETGEDVVTSDLTLTREG